MRVPRPRLGAPGSRAAWQGRSPARLLAIAAAFACAASAAFAAPATTSVHLEELTWPELRDRVAAGTTIALVPVGGTEQNGPHMTLGKHNRRVRALAQRIAEQLGQAIVAPVVAYVPEGSVDPPAAHMRWPGTITVTETTFESMLETTARSLQRAGLRHVFLLGDHGGYRASLDRVARKVPGVHAMPEYYRASTRDLAASLKAQGFRAEQIGEHAGLADTALMLGVDSAAVRADAARARVSTQTGDGVSGDPREASVTIGRAAADHVVAVSVAAIRAIVTGAAKTATPAKPQ
jgi:creatinine amidohydrolase/Fe(II)-dependent formamide hydrolase-like protein